MASISDQNEYQERLTSALAAIQKLRGQLETLKRSRTEPIAIIGMGCRYPGDANDPESFWQNLLDGVDAIGEIPADRWDVDEYYDPDQQAPGKIHTRMGGFLRDVDQFDAHFFGISPREAVSMDPQQRLLLEVTWHALEHANQNPTALGGSQTGVFVGVTISDYLMLQNSRLATNQIDAYRLTGNTLNSVAGRLSYTLGFHGPTMSVDTACSSSLVAIHLACQSLRNQECEMALAGGVNLILSPEAFISASKANMLAPDGRCKTFDARADGFARSEGCGVVVLKRLSDAQAAGDNILAVILGSAVNHGGFSSGFIVPNKHAQEALIRSALKNAGVQPAQVQYIEAHGTGTSLGDPIEVRALASALKEGRPAHSKFWLGSVKTNIGHAESASGVAGVIKTVLALQHEEIPPHLHFQTPSPMIDWQNVPAIVPTQRVPWTGADRIAGVSGFGATGTNAHIVLAPAPLRETISDVREVNRPSDVLTLSAKSDVALLELARRYAGFLGQHPDASLADLCFTANTGRALLNHRMAMVADSVGQLREDLNGFAGGQDLPNLVRHQSTDRSPARVAFLFTGQGSQYTGMARRLYETEPVFRETLDRCDHILRSRLEKPILDVLYPSAETPIDDSALLDQTAYTQPALFAIEYSLAELWRSWGITPAAVMGHSIGEYVAACVAGVFSLEDGLELISERGRLMQALPLNGGMAAVFAEESQVRSAISAYGEDLSIAAINGPDNIVISGKKTAINAACETLKQQGIKCRALEVSHAFHSSMMDPMLDSLRKAAAEVRFHSPQIPLVSNLTGQLFKAGEIPDAEYWVKHTRQPVRFAAGIETLYQQGSRVFLELGPSSTLIGMGQRSVDDAACVWLPSLREGRDDWSILLKTLGTLHVHGVNVDWKAFHPKHTRQALHLPTYPFQRQSYWIKPSPRKRAAHNGDLLHLLLGRRLETAGTEIIFENELTSEAPAFLQDHVVQGQVILPATAYVEMMLAAASHVHDGTANEYHIDDVVFYAPLSLSADEPVSVQTVVNRLANGQLNCGVYSRDEKTKQWKQHASATISVHSGSTATVSLNDIENRCDQVLTAPEHYQRTSARGLGFGSAFRGLTQLRLGRNESLARIEAPEAISSELPLYRLHPAILDAALQTTAMLLPDGAQTYLPMSVNSMKVHGPLPAAFWSHATLHNPDGAHRKVMTSNIELFDDAGHLLASLEGFSAKEVTGADADAWLYETHWQKAELAPQTKVFNETGKWLVFAEGTNFSNGIVEQLRSQKQSVRVIQPGDRFDQSEQDRVTVDPACADDFKKLLREESACDGVIYLWALNESVEQSTLCGGLLHLVQAIVATGRSLPIWVVTRGAQAVHGPVNAPSQATLWGLCKVIQLEHPEISCHLFDLDADLLVRPEEQLHHLWRAVGSLGSEEQIAIRGTEYFVPRLARVRQDAANTTEPVELVIQEAGTLDSLEFRKLSRRSPGPDEVEIQIHAAGIGFRDVLNALGMYPGGGELGSECAGVISAVGEGVETFAIGDPVIAVAMRSFASYVVTPAHFVVAKPRGLTFGEAASIPSAFLTTYYALHQVAKIKAGDRVLIHAAAGGVGQAAVQLALRAGAEVFGTAGSFAKRAMLKSLGVQHVFDSRTLAFAEEIMDITNGRGVDIVLNSLANEFIPKSVSALARDGRFLEIGKRGIWSQEQFSQVRPDASYHVIDLLYDAGQDPELIGELFAAIMPLFESESLRPLPVRVYPAANTVDAFRGMALGRHTGKLVISQTLPPASIRSDGTYLITGGLGGLGLAAAERLVQDGARHLVLTGRDIQRTEAGPLLQKLQQAGAQVKVMQADVSDREQMKGVFAEIEASMPPLRVVIHAAGVLEDGVLRNQTWERFASVFAPKVDGAWLLHELTKGMALDFFVLFSSAVTFLGAIGQSGYAAANSYLDALAHYRRAQGLPALSVGWGPWLEIGMAEKQNVSERHFGGAVDALSPAQGIEIFSRLLTSDHTHVGVIPIQWARFASQVRSPYYANLSQAGADHKIVTNQPAEQNDIWRRLNHAPESRRKNLLLSYVREQTIRVLSLPVDFPLEQRQPFQEIGMDSLMAVELRNVLSRGLSLARTLPATLAFDHPTPEALTQYLLAEFFQTNSGATSELKPSMSAETTELSDEEAEALLLAELDELQQKKNGKSTR